MTKLGNGWWGRGVLAMALVSFAVPVQALGHDDDGQDWDGDGHDGHGQDWDDEGHGSHGHGHDHDWDDEDECLDLTGDFSSAVDASPDCTSPVGFCTNGLLTGDIEGTYRFTMDSMAPISDDPAETTFTFTGSDTITTDDGVIYGQDTGTLTFSGDFAFMTIVHAVSGDGCYEDVTGDLVATGNLDLVSGVTSGTWTANFCGVEQCFQEDEGHHEGECH